MTNTELSKLKGPVSTKTGVVLTQYDIDTYLMLSMNTRYNRTVFINPYGFSDPIKIHMSLQKLQSIGLASKRLGGYCIGEVELEEILDLETDVNEYNYR